MLFIPKSKLLPYAPFLNFVVGEHKTNQPIHSALSLYLCTMAADKSQTSMNYATGEVKESVNSSFNSSFAAHYPFQNQDPTPLCNKISTVLGGLGYSTVQFIPTDVDSESK